MWLCSLSFAAQRRSSQACGGSHILQVTHAHADIWQKVSGACMQESCQGVIFRMRRCAARGCAAPTAWRVSATQNLVPCTQIPARRGGNIHLVAEIGRCAAICLHRVALLLLLLLAAAGGAARVGRAAVAHRQRTATVCVVWLLRLFRLLRLAGSAACEAGERELGQPMRSSSRSGSCCSVLLSRGRRAHACGGNRGHNVPLILFSAL